MNVSAFAGFAPLREPKAVGQNALDFFWMMSAIGRADFWKGLGNALLSCAQGFIAMMLDGVAKVLGALKNISGIGSRMGKAADAVHGQAESWRASDGLAQMRKARKV